VAGSHGGDRDRRWQNPSQQEDRPQAAARLGPSLELQRNADYAYRPAVEPPASKAGLDFLAAGFIIQLASPPTVCIVPT
jgi:hypothetical protein